MRAGQQLVADLLRQVPELTPTFDEHTRANDEVLPHVFFGDLTRFVQAQLVRGNHDLVKRTLDVLEAADGSPDVQNLIGASFLENLELDAWGWNELVRIAGPSMKLTLARELKRCQDSE